MKTNLLKSIFISLILVMGVSNTWAYTLYLYTGSFGSWNDSNAKFQVYTNKNINATSLGNNWYSFDVGTFTGTAYIKRMDSSNSSKWNEFSASISSTNNITRVTNWNAGTVTDGLYLAGDNWGDIGSWSTNDADGKMTISSGTIFTSKTFTGITASAHEFKIAFKNTWDNAIGHNGKVSCVNGTEANNGGNIKFTPYIAGDVTITYDVSTGNIVITCPAPTITFDKEGGSGGTSTQSAPYGDATSKITAPTKTGYTFGGYYTGDNGTGTQIIDTDGNWIKSKTNFTDANNKWIVTSNKTLYAKWTEKTYLLTFKHDGNGTIKVGGTTVNSGGTASVNHVNTKTLVATPNTGYNFSSWTLSGSNTGAVTIGSTTTASTTIKATKTGATVTANFTPKTYTITLNANGGAGNGSATATYNSSTITNLTHPTRTDHRCNGYYTATSGGTLVLNIDGTLAENVSGYTTNGNWTKDGNATLYAQWTYDVTEYTVTFGAGTGFTSYGSVTANNNSTSATITSPATVRSGQNITFTATPKTGYEVEGWYTNAACTTGKHNAGNTTYTTTITAATNVYVKFVEKTWSVAFAASTGGAVSPKETQTVGEANGVTIIATPNKGYTFAGWTSSTGGKFDDAKAVKTEFYPTAATTVTASFTENKYTIFVESSNKDFGTVSPESGSAGIDTKVTITATPKLGYKFVNWTATNGITIADANSTITTITASAAGTVTANFEEKTANTVYLKPSDEWKNDNARFAVYYWKDSENGWVDMTDIGCTGEYYKADIPIKYTDIIFCRMNPNATEYKFEEGIVWNQTGNLKVPTDDKVLYTIGKYDPNKIYLIPDNNWKGGNARFVAYFFDSGSDWYNMTDPDGDGTYECDRKSDSKKVVFVRFSPDDWDNNWDKKWTQTEDQTIPTNGDNICTISSTTTDKDTKSKGSWSAGETSGWTTYTEPNITIKLVKTTNGTITLGTTTSGNSDKTVTTSINSTYVLNIQPADGYVLASCRIQIGNNPEIEGVDGNTYTFCGNATITAEFAEPVDMTQQRVHEGNLVNYNQNNGWVGGNGTKANPYTLYSDEAVRITVNALPTVAGKTAYYKFGLNEEQTENVFDWKDIDGSTATNLRITAYYKDANGNKSGEKLAITNYYKFLPLPFYLMTDPNKEINIDRVAAGDNILVQFRSDAQSTVDLFVKIGNQTEEQWEKVKESALENYIYDIDNAIEPCILHFIARSSSTTPTHGRIFEVKADVAIYKNVIIKVNDPEGWVKNAYMWRDGSGDVLTSWPGDPVLQNFDTWRVFSVKYPYYDRFIVNNGQTDGVVQTIGWVVPKDDMCYELVAPENYEHPVGEDTWKYGLTVADCPKNLIVKDIEEVTIMEGEQIVVMPKIFVGLGYKLSDIVADITFNDNSRSVRAMMSGTNIVVLGTSEGSSNVTVSYTLGDERTEKTFKVTVEKKNVITIQVKVPIGNSDNYNTIGWNDNSLIKIHYWFTGKDGDIPLRYVYEEANKYKYMQAEVPLDANGKTNFLIGYNDINEPWEKTADITNVTTDGCYTLKNAGYGSSPTATRDSEVCWDENDYADYQVKVLMQNGKTYLSNITYSKEAILSFFAPGKDATGRNAGAVMLYRNGKLASSIDPATFDESNVYIATINETGDGLTNIASYTGNYYIRTWGTDNDINNKGWNSIHDWTDSEKASRTFTKFTSRKGEFYNHYWVQAMHTDFEGKDVSACVANDYNDDLAGKLMQDKNTTATGDIKLGGTGKTINVRFGYDPRTNYFARAVLFGSEYENYLNLHCDNAYTDKNCTKKLPYGNHNNTSDNRFSDISNWVYERDIYVNITNTTPSASVYVEGRSPHVGENGKAVIYNHLLGYVTNEVTGIESETPIQKTVIGTGTNNGVYLVRVVYDFKTNRIITAWLPQGTIEVSTEKTINADVLFVRKENEDVPQINLSSQGKIKSLESMFFAMEFHRGDKNPANRHQEQYWFTLPFDCKVGSISGVHGYMQIWGIQRYRGDLRAQKGWYAETPTFWEWLDTEDVMHAGEGYLLVFDKKNAPWNEIGINDGADTISMMRLYFPSDTSGFDMQQQSAEHLTRTYENHTCTLTLHDRHKQDSNWKVIGTTSYNNAGITEYVEDTNPEYEELNGNTPPNFRYAYEYTMSNDNKTFSYKYTPEDGQTATYKSFFGYMVQFAGTISWQPIMSETVPEGIAARRRVAEGERTSYTTRLEFADANGEKQDQAFVALDEKATTDFDQNKDLNKVINRGNNIYTMAENIAYAGNTLPMKKQTVPVGVVVATAGEYTFRMPDGTDGISVILLDNQTGAHTNMLYDEYTITLDAGTYENRFSLSVDPNRSATSVENIFGDDNEENGDKATGVKKFIIDGQLFIRTANGLFDAKGQRL